MADDVRLTAVSSGYYRVRVNGTHVSQHTTEREAIEVAENALRDDPSAEVEYTHDYRVLVTIEGEQEPEPEPEPDPEPQPEPDPGPEPEPDPSPTSFLFASAWPNLGNSQSALTEGGKWNALISADYQNTMEVIPSTGLDFPTQNVLQVKGTASRSGWAELRMSGLSLPQVGESRYYRWYMRVAMPDGLVDDQTHPIQDNYLVNWGFIVINGGGGAGVPNGKWRPEFWNEGGPWPWTRHRGPVLDKNQTYRFEMQVHRIGTSTWNMHVRVYDSADTMIASDANYNNDQGSGNLGSNPTLSLVNVSGLNGITAGNNGIGNNPPFPFTISYQGAFAVSADTWCGEYKPSVG